MSANATETDVYVVLVTVPSRETGADIAEALVGAHLAACVNIVGPLRSVYYWEGQINQDDEHLLMIKTTAERYPELEARVLAIHPYDTPEVIALPIAMGSAAYLGWIRDATR